MNTTISIKNRWTGSVLFEYSKDGNTIKDTVLEALKISTDLGDANLRDANLGGADLGGANLGDANLGGANLGGANLRGANLGGANLGGANLRDANLGGADLRDANLGGADLRDANLRGANLGDADLGDADLRDANLGGANLRGANLRGANLRDANLGGGIKIEKTAVFTGIYKYICMPIIAADGKHYIRLGCYTKLVSEWEENFWNNDTEFPNDNSLKSQYRVMAYDTCKKWIKLNK